MSETFKEGYNSFIHISNSMYGANQADKYITDIANACDTLEKSINSFKGYETGIKQLKGDVQEFGQAGSFNIRAILNHSKYRANVDRSHGLASPDITTNWGKDYGLKACFDGKASAKAQSISYFEKFKEYCAQSGRHELGFDDYLLEKGINPSSVFASDPIYGGQIPLIPDDQIPDAIKYYKYQIDHKSVTNPDEVYRYKYCLERLTSKITAPDGTQSGIFTTEELKEMAAQGKEGKYSAAVHGYSPADLIEIEHVLNEGLRAGLTAATISLVLKTAPEIYKCLDQLLSSGKISEESLKKLGFAAIDGATEGFLRGFIAASLTTACESGMLGQTMESLAPEVLGAMTVVAMNTIKDSFLMVKGTLSRNEFTFNLQRNLFVTCCGVGTGALLQSLLPVFPLSYLLGNFVGAMVGSFAFVAYDKAILSFCISSGSTFFGLVDQDYSLPDFILEELGVDLFKYEESLPKEYSANIYRCSEYYTDESDFNMIMVIRRGVIGAHQVGYIV